MEERHENEQYFFDEATLEELANWAAPRGRVACVCAPLLGRRLAERGADVAVLDVDERFADVPGFARYDLNGAPWLGERFDLIVCDPPFFGLSLGRLAAGLRTLARNDFAQPLVVGYLKRREEAFLKAFEAFELRPTGYEPGYATVRPTEKNRIELYANVPEPPTRRTSER